MLRWHDHQWLLRPQLTAVEVALQHLSRGGLQGDPGRAFKGWRANALVRHGNEAAEQHQADAYTQVLDLLYFYERLGGTMPEACAATVRGLPMSWRPICRSPMPASKSGASRSSAFCSNNTPAIRAELGPGNTKRIQAVIEQFQQAGVMEPSA